MKNIDYTKSPYNSYDEIQELNMLKKAVRNKQNLKRFIYTSDDTLRQQILTIYPEATNIVVVNNDKRDALGTPTIISRTVRSQFIMQTTSIGKRVIRSRNFESFKIILCLVENGFVNVKVVTKEWRDPY